MVLIIEEYVREAVEDRVIRGRLARHVRLIRENHPIIRIGLPDSEGVESQEYYLERSAICVGAIISPVQEEARSTETMVAAEAERTPEKFGRDRYWLILLYGGKYKEPMYR